MGVEQHTEEREKGTPRDRNNSTVAVACEEGIFPTSGYEVLPGEFVGQGGGSGERFWDRPVPVQAQGQRIAGVLFSVGLANNLVLQRR